MTPKISQYLAENEVECPVLVVDLDVVEARYRALGSALPETEIFYAVKANPAMPVLERLVSLGSSFDAASINEIDRCFAAGATAERISYGNTLKKASAIIDAYAKGITLYAFDCIEELEKIAKHAPGSRVYCRILVNRYGAGANWPLSRKFGCSSAMAHDLLLRARELGLVPYGLSFHVGSQQLEPVHWGKAIADVSVLFDALRESGVELKMINMGGGFPATYRDASPELEGFASAIRDYLHESFSGSMPRVLIEPGRFIIAEAGVLASEVVAVSIKDYAEEVRWVYLDIGKFTGLAETLDESITYNIRTTKDGSEEGTGPVVLAGPTCDSMDTMYERTLYELPLDLAAGDKVFLESAGAYTTSYASQGFNGFAPPKEVYL